MSFPDSLFFVIFPLCLSHLVLSVTESFLHNAEEGRMGRGDPIGALSRIEPKIVVEIYFYF